MKEIEIYLRKLILNIYLLFHTQKKSDHNLILAKEDKILLVRLNKIGDALVTTPLIKEIKEQTGCTIHVLADSKNRFIFEYDKYVDHTFVFEKDARVIKILRNKLENENYKAVFDLHDNVSTTVTIFLGSLNIVNKVGFEKSNKKIFTHLIPHRNPSETHIVERYFEFFNFLDLSYDPNEIRIIFNPGKSAEEKVRNYLRNNFSGTEFLVGINISAGSEARFWGMERYKQLISYFSEFDVNLLLLCSPSDKTKAEQISGGDGKIFIDEEFQNFAAMIEQLDFLFTPDTSIVHLASAFNVPMFGIYVKYKTENTVWYPYNTEHELVVTEERDFYNLEFKTVIEKLKCFFEKIYNG